MNHLLARKKSLSSLRGRQSESSSSTPSDQKPGEAKSTQYLRPSYIGFLATMGSHMDESDLGITDESKEMCQRLLISDQRTPTDSLFRDDLFKSTCRKIQNKNETRVIRDISLLIVPSAETLATYGAKHLQLLIESVNEGWNNSIPLFKPRPQPDYSVGFRREAFNDAQLRKLEPFVGDISNTFTSYFLATWYMYFPFMTCEVKCGTATLDIADQQNAHSMTLAVRGIVEFFRLVDRETELHQQILAFSISHDNQAVRIYGHYPVVNSDKTTFYRHPIHTFDFTALEGRDKWTAYKFVRNAYDIWMPMHFKRICSVIDELPPGVGFRVSQQSDLDFPETSGLSQDLDSHHLSLEEYGSQSRLGGSPELTSNTTPSHSAECRRFKVPKKRRV